MSEPVKLPREVAEAIDTISRMDGYQMRLLEAMFNATIELSAEMLVIDEWADKEHGNFELLLQALVIGFEVEQTPEEKAIQWLKNTDCLRSGFSAHGIVMAIKNLLKEP